MKVDIFKFSLATLLTDTVYAAAAYANGEGYGQVAESGEGLEEIIEVLGITTLTCLIITLTLGLLMPKARKKIFPWHRRMGFITVISGILHGVMILTFH